MKKVAIIAYRFPPYSGIGAMRMRCVAQHLPEFQWEPIVFTSDWSEANCDRIDHNCDEAVLGRVIARAKRVDSGGSTRSGKLGRIRQLYQEFVSRREFYKHTLRCFERYVDENGKPDLVLATYPVAAAFSAADVIHKRFGIPWVADFRDLPDYLHKRPCFAISHSKRLVSSCDHILTVSKPLANVLRARHGKEVSVIPNGFDSSSADTNSRVGLSKNRKFTLTYTGLLYPPGHPARISPAIYFKALDALADEQRIDLANVSVRLIGTKEEAVRRHFADRSSERCVEIVEWCEREEAAREQRSADLLLSLGSTEIQGVVTGKVFEYLNSGTPILSAPHDVDGVGFVLEKSGAGETVETVDEAKEVIRSHYERWNSPSPIPIEVDQEFIRSFDWDRLTGRVAECFDVCKGNGAVK
ncbi:glycosyltransferase [Roseiconus lacunae]|uniref:glycosyltransferase n=1 Tax=Roseiconus lacunae TaxID=2605694 RepID=UPI001E462103|nr:glycosyltransferase [Roseiconus lacunae]MCD0458736.1 glycosyltransferase [Roseiconus lacunae]